MENAQVAGEVIGVFLALNAKTKIESTVDFVISCFEEAKKEKSFQIRQISEKLVDVLVEKQAFFEAMKICTAAETSLKRLELIESLSFASIRRKEALVHLKDPQV